MLGEPVVVEQVEDQGLVEGLGVRQVLELESLKKLTRRGISHLFISASKRFSLAADKFVQAKSMMVVQWTPN